MKHIHADNLAVLCWNIFFFSSLRKSVGQVDCMPTIAYYKS